ncbi:MAG TPA: efflux transporter outer membrane subunit [Candidatus Acidoferrales bacterium]|nr:efflux transporter outer membrane subunit [Candidatus Acidoferrales bacterium]
MSTRASRTPAAFPRPASLGVFVGLFVAFFSACTVGPNYNRPKADVPTSYRGPGPEETPSAEAASLADEKWWNVFQDKELQGLIRTALTNNYDVRIAASRVLQAQAQLGVTRADQFPSLSGGANITSIRNPTIGPVPAFEFTSGEMTATALWNLDFWGKYRRATEAARANLMASDWARRQVISTLVANVASGYFQLRELDLALEISRETLASRKESLGLTTQLTEHGIDTMLDQRQAEELVYTAAAQIPDLERQIAQQENAISLLLGNNPGPIPRGLKLTEQPHAPEVPAGLPSSLLERRPDIRQAEENLVAANAQIGVAKAAFFPQITLTGTAGFQSSALSDLFTGPQGVWSLSGGLTQPIFQGGRLKNNLRLAQAQEQQALLTYQQTIQGAFRDVSNALVAYRKNREFRIEQEHLTASAQDAARLSEMRLKAGATDYLEVLTSETNYFADELGLVQAQFNELQALVQIYQVLGGGWQQ